MGQSTNPKTVQERLIMRAIILAAGSGQRLRPYTRSIPKCMVEVAGRSLLHRQIDVMRSLGIEQISIVTGHLAKKIQVDGIRKLHNPAYSTTNMVGSLFVASKVLTTGDDVIVSYGDIIYEKQVLERVINCEAPICLPVDVEWERLWSARMPNPMDDAETLKMNQAGDITELGKKPLVRSDIEAQYIGLIKFNSNLAKQLPDIYTSMDKSALFDGKDFRNMQMTSFIQWLIDCNWQAKSIKISNGWLEVDTRDDLDMYNDMHRNDTLSEFIQLN
jgi:choline kinase